MRPAIKLFICVALMFVAVMGQERMRKIMAGQNGDQARVVIVFTNVLEGGYKLESMIIDLSKIKSAGEQPASVQVDLTSTVRSLVDGTKQQKAFILRWNKTAQVELKCNGKWTKHEPNAAIKNVMEVTRTVYQQMPLDAKKPVETSLAPELEKEVSSILQALKPEDFPCLRVEN